MVSGVNLTPKFTSGRRLNMGRPVTGRDSDRAMKHTLGRSRYDLELRPQDPRGNLEGDAVRQRRLPLHGRKGVEDIGAQGLHPDTRAAETPQLLHAQHRARRQLYGEPRGLPIRPKVLAAKADALARTELGAATRQTLAMIAPVSEELGPCVFEHSEERFKNRG